MSLYITNVPLLEDDAIKADFHLCVCVCSFLMLLKTHASLISSSHFALPICTAK